MNALSWAFIVYCSVNMVAMLAGCYGSAKALGREAVLAVAIKTVIEIALIVWIVIALSN